MHLALARRPACLPPLVLKGSPPRSPTAKVEIDATKPLTLQMLIAAVNTAVSPADGDEPASLHELCVQLG